MYEKVSERSEALDDRIDEFAELVELFYQVKEFGDPAASTEVRCLLLSFCTAAEEQIRRKQ